MLHDPAQLDLMVQALADQARRRMACRLSRPRFGQSDGRAAGVQHLKSLEASGLVRTQKPGRVRTCQIGPSALRAAEHRINERRLASERRRDRLGDSPRDET